MPWPYSNADGAKKPEDLKLGKDEFKSNFSSSIKMIDVLLKDTYNYITPSNHTFFVGEPPLVKEQLPKAFKTVLPKTYMDHDANKVMELFQKKVITKQQWHDYMYSGKIPPEAYPSGSFIKKLTEDMCYSPVYRSFDLRIKIECDGIPGNNKKIHDSTYHIDEQHLKSSTDPVEVIEKIVDMMLAELKNKIMSKMKNKLEGKK